MIGKISRKSQGAKENQEPLLSMHLDDDTKKALLKHFAENCSIKQYFTKYTLSDGIKTLIKCSQLLISILSKEQRQQYDTNLIHIELLQLKEQKLKQQKIQQDYQERINTLEQKDIDNLKIIGNLKRQITSLQQNKRKLQKKIDQLTKYYSDTIQELKQQLNQELIEQNPHKNEIFMGEILSKAKDYQSYLHEALQNITRKKIKDAKLLYRWDPHNEANFHLYIDDHPNILLVVLTKAQYYIAAFTEDPFIPNSSPSKQGCIFSLTNRQCFKNIKRPIIYDPYHIIFGNSQLRIGTKKKQIFSNFGVLNAYYQGTGMSVSTLLGADNQRTVQIENYQILEIIFK